MGKTRPVLEEAGLRRLRLFRQRPEERGAGRRAEAAAVAGAPQAFLTTPWHRQINGLSEWRVALTHTNGESTRARFRYDGFSGAPYSAKRELRLSALFLTAAPDSLEPRAIWEHAIRRFVVPRIPYRE